MTINENWSAHARIDYDVQKDETAAAKSVEVNHIWTEGQYDKFNVKLGRFGSFSNASHGLVFDTEVTGAEFTYAPTEAWKVKATAGRVDNTKLWSTAAVKRADDTFDNNGSATYWAVEADYAQGKWDAGLGYRNVGATNTWQDDNKTSFHVVDLGVGYAFDKNVKLTGDYAWGPGLDSNEHEGVAKNAYSIQLNYKGADAADAGSWGTYVAYRSLAPFAAFAATYDHKAGAEGFNTLKGWEIGADYTFTKNIVASAKYFNGKDTDKAVDDKVTGMWTRVDFLF